MKNLKIIVIVGLMLVAGKASFAQNAKTIALEQTPGEFTTKELKLKSNTPYVFEVKNNGIDHEVGFVIAPEGKTGQNSHIKSAYLPKAIANGELAVSGEVTLEKGSYVYFCPLNPTPQYKIIVE